MNVVQIMKPFDILKHHLLECLKLQVRLECLKQPERAPAFKRASRRMELRIKNPPKNGKSRAVKPRAGGPEINLSKTNKSA